MTTEPVDPLTDLAGLSKPANTLIKKISAAVGGLFRPYQIKRIGKAQAEADLTSAQSEIEITDLHRRAVRRWIEEEAQHQQNIEDITSKALPELNDAANPDDMEDDWITNFFDKSRIVTDSEMQNLWSRVLANEANVPGTYSKRTVNLLADLDKAEAILFSGLCGFCWEIAGTTPLVLDTSAEIYRSSGINFETLSHLETIGFIQFNGVGNYSLHGLPKMFLATYFGHRLILEMPKSKNNSFNIGHVRLTKTGLELMTICDSNPVDGFVDYIMDAWKTYNPKTIGRNHVERPRR